MDNYKKAKILIVDDQQHNRDLVKFFLQQAGFSNFIEADNAEDGYAMAVMNMPDIIYLDIQLDEDSGFDVCKDLKNNKKTRDIPVLFLSAFNEADNRVQGYKLGAVDFVNKPINHYELIARTKVHLKNGQLVKQLQEYQTRMSYELEKAKKVQNAIIPSKHDQEKIESKYNLEIKSVFNSSSELAGDYWKVIDLEDNKVGFVLADFSGHGVYSALNTIRIDLFISQMSKELLSDVEKSVVYLNKNLYEALPAEDFCSIVYFVIDTKTGDCEYVATNTPDLYVLKADKETIIPLQAKGFPLGMAKNMTKADYTYNKINLDLNDGVIMYSDALIEEPHKDGSRWLDDGFKNILYHSQHQGIEKRFDYIINSFNATAKKPLKDDLTVIYLKRV